VAELVYFRIDPYEGGPRNAEETSLDRYIPEFEVPTDDENPIVIQGFSGRMQ
jgi:hypothetical protein